MSLVVPVEEVDPLDRARFGGKACGLARLVSRGLPVPPALVLPVEAWRAFLSLNGLEALARRAHREPEAAADLRRRVLTGRLPPELAGALRERAAHLGDRLAVRSSAVDEDGAATSFAGQHETVLNVRPGDEVEQALRRCWASLYGEPVLAYRARLGLPAPSGMGVVVQRLVDARVSGVVFTIDPVSGSWREMLVEAVLGQGEALVSGRVLPDRYRLRRPRRQLKGSRRVLARLRLEVLAEDRVSQVRRLVPGAPGALDWEAVPQPEARKLDTATLLRVGRMGLRAEALGRAPQDLEWAVDHQGRLFVLQARAITASGPPKRGGEVLWTRRFLGERWLELATPMGWSIVGGLIDWFIAYPGASRGLLGGAPATRLVKGRPYVNVSVFRHLAFKLPGLPPPSFMMDFLPPEEVDRWTRRFAYPPDPAVYRAILRETWDERRWRRFRWNPLTNHRAWDRFVARLDTELPGLAPRGPGAEEAAVAVERGVELLREYVKIHIISLLLANIAYQVLSGVLPPELAPELLRSPTGNRTTQANAALVALGSGRLSLDAVIAEYGHRSFTSSWEIFALRWREDPEQLLALARQAARAPEGHEAERAQATREAEAALRAQLPPGRRWSLLAALRWTQRHLQLREDQRFQFDRIGDALKRGLLELGARLGLEDPGDVRWLLWVEAKDLAAGRLSRATAQELIERRRRQWQAHAREPAPPIFLVGDEEVEVGEGLRRLTGVGISAGRATGTVRVLRSPAEAERLAPGEILVAEATDPGWTPLFLVAGGLVLELGSMLSHGAVVAREYGLPAVVNVPGATRTLRDGQRVTVDGGRGEIRVEDP
ncbi:MAG: hypothetical protein H6740_05635 [Alphaproteobacteria bacterium]|nr:hypothetical protein [Alphaproteobacteria bacterium]